MCGKWFMCALPKTSLLYQSCLDRINQHLLLFSRIALFAFIILTAFTHTHAQVHRHHPLEYRDYYYHFSPFTCMLPLMLMLFVSYYYFYIESHATALLMHTMDCSGYVFHRRCCKWDVVHKHAYHYPLLFLMKLVLGQ